MSFPIVASIGPVEFYQFGTFQTTLQGVKDVRNANTNIPDVSEFPDVEHSLPAILLWTASLPACSCERDLNDRSPVLGVNILTYHVVSGKVTAAKLRQKIKAGGGSAKLKTVNGEILSARMSGDSISLIDTKGIRQTSPSAT